jgi:hypothetical protein
MPSKACHAFRFASLSSAPLSALAIRMPVTTKVMTNSGGARYNIQVAKSCNTSFNAITNLGRFEPGIVFGGNLPPPFVEIAGIVDFIMCRENLGRQDKIQRKMRIGIHKYLEAGFFLFNVSGTELNDIFSNLWGRISLLPYAVTWVVIFAPDNKFHSHLCFMGGSLIESKQH